MSRIWVINGKNKLLEAPWGHISYNPDTTGLMGGLGSGDGSGEETAVVVHTEETEHFYILNGDFRPDYEKLIDEGLDACLDFFQRHSDARSSWSETLPTRRKLRGKHV